MEKKLHGNIAGFGTLKDYYDEDFMDTGMSELVLRSELTTKECERLCAGCLVTLW
ncbi:hypothetical protein [Oceanobacillus kapialis]|uniref:hypothetical protein n=1 Tax=Oceanobacillus kapialis TaxID=481353 RepID=UPI00384C2754